MYSSRNEKNQSHKGLSLEVLGTSYIKIKVEQFAKPQSYGFCGRVCSKTAKKCLKVQIYAFKLMAAWRQSVILFSYHNTHPFESADFIGLQPFSIRFCSGMGFGGTC